MTHNNNNITIYFTSSILQSPTSSGLLPTAVTLLLAMGFVAAFGRSRIGRDGAHGEEPPEVKSAMPFIGHLVGMLKWQVGYFQMLSSKAPSYKAFTLKIFVNRIYVICDPSLIQAAYRDSKGFDFGPFIVDSSRRAFDIGAQGMKIIRGETAPGYDPNGPFLNGNKGDSYLNESHRIMVEALRPGPGMLELNRGALNKLAMSLNEVDLEVKKISLYKWMRDTLTLANADALYGPHNPVAADPSLIDSLWHFEQDMALLMLQFLPTLIVPNAYRGRAAIKDAFTKFYTSSHHLTASKLIQTRFASAQKWGFSIDDIANFEISTLFLSTTNAVPTSFWLLANIVTNPSLLSSIREEVSTILTRTKGDDGQEECIMDITLFQSHCPLLLSSFRETLRLVDAATSVRTATKDVHLTSPTSPTTYLIKAGNVIQLPSGITHNCPQIWGSDVNTFNPRRFLPSTIAALPHETKRLRKQGYFPFGGGKHLCPGRHFATTETLAFVGSALMLFQFDGVTLPELAFQKLGTAVRKPVGDVVVGMKRRGGWESVRLRFDVGKEKVDLNGLLGEGEGDE